MDNIFVQIFLMMAFCFAIGFAVAAVIKLIAVAADALNYNHTRAQELKRLRHIRKLNHIHAMNLTYTARSFKPYLRQDEKDVSDGEDDYDHHFPRASVGLSEFSLMDYYYPDERIEIMEKID